MKKRVISGMVILLLVIMAAGGGYLYALFFLPNVQKTGKLYIPSNAGYAQVIDSLKPFLKNESRFRTAANIKKYAAQIHPGRYTLAKGMGNNALVNLLRSGKQDAIAIRIGNYSTIYELAGRVAPLLECDSQEIVAGILSADFAQGIDSDALLYFFVPNTYNFHWNLSGTGFVRKMKGYFDQFWNADRLSSARAEGMSPLQVTILASIVQLESTRPDEQPKVARLYLNRLKAGMKLDADPTVIFAMKRSYGRSIKINRVYYKNLLIPSPYNTYMHKGLPPGPICMPNASAIDAVLHPADHDFLYFVADPSRPGYHIFAHTLSEQERNARQYRQWIDSVEIESK
ncbi:MAG TPA: endolytic transglycosylase MltG [Edaphocola sp.]|nr:endolytic transglycosylase MltG [Edaphocola sp.]